MARKIPSFSGELSCPLRAESDLKDPLHNPFPWRKKNKNKDNFGEPSNVSTEDKITDKTVPLS